VSRAPAEHGNKDAALALAQLAWPGECAGPLTGVNDTKDDPFAIRQIAQRLDMGSWKSLNNKLYLAGKRTAKESKSKRAKK